MTALPMTLSLVLLLLCCRPVWSSWSW